MLLLIGLLALLGCLRAAAGRVGLCFLLGGVLLGVGLVLLCLALIDQVVTTRDGSDRFLRLTLDVFHGALDAFCGPTVLVSHNSPLRLADLPGVLPCYGLHGAISPRATTGFPTGRVAKRQASFAGRQYGRIPGVLRPQKNPIGPHPCDIL